VEKCNWDAECVRQWDSNKATFEALPLGPKDAYTLARNSFEASFASDTKKRGWIDTLDAAFASA